MTAPGAGREQSVVSPGPPAPPLPGGTGGPEHETGGESTGTVVVAGLANFGIAIAKFVGGLISHSSAMLSEAAHSIADTVTEVLLFVALRRGDRPADDRHPFQPQPTLVRVVVDEADRHHGVKTILQQHAYEQCAADARTVNQNRPAGAALTTCRAQPLTLPGKPGGWACPVRLSGQPFRHGRAAPPAMRKAEAPARGSVPRDAEPHLPPPACPVGPAHGRL